MSCASSKAATEWVAVASTRRSIHVVALSLSLIAQDRVGVRDFFEFRLIPSLLVGVILLSQFVVSDFERLLRCVFLHSQRFVIVFLWIPILAEL